MAAEVPIAGRKIRTAEEARASLAAAEEAGVSRVEWARAHGIDARSLNAWRVNLERTETGDPPRLRLVELVAEVKSNAPIVVCCGPFEVEVPTDFDEQALGRLLRLLTTC